MFVIPTKFIAYRPTVAKFGFHLDNCLYTVKSRAVDRSTIQFWKLWAYINIKFPLHKHSENAWECYKRQQSNARDFTEFEIINSMHWIRRY